MVDLSGLPLVIGILLLLLLGAVGIPWVGRFFFKDVAGEQTRGILAVEAFVVLILLGLAAVAAYPPGGQQAFNLTGVLFMAAVTLLGFALGFLFSLPQLVQPSPTGPGQTTAAPREDLVYRTNSTLEQISDWLSKIIVGVGLTQLLSAADKLRELGGYFGPMLGGDASTSERVAVIIFLYSLTCGFFVGYLWTRLFLASAFKWADSKLVRGIQDELQRTP